jgi:hypothetical protein
MISNGPFCVDCVGYGLDYQDKIWKGWGEVNVDTVDKGLR